MLIWYSKTKTGKIYLFNLIPNNMKDIYNQLKNIYDSFLDDGELVISEDQLEEYLSNRSDIQWLLESVLVGYKTVKNRIKNLQTEEKMLKTIIGGCMNRLDIDEIKTDDAKVSTQQYFKIEVDLEKLPKEYLMQSSAKIQSALRKWQQIDGVVAVSEYKTRTIR